MNYAATLFDDVAHEKRRLTIQETFEEYHARNPKVYELFHRFADELRSRGVVKYSSDAILHRIRWHYAVEIDPADCNGGFKINDNFSSRYARLLIEEDPSFAAFFELRRLLRE